MDSTLPPDPYKALGLTRDADQALIKSTYRKLALKCHPDKVTDESLKKQKQEEFHKIQQAYEVIGDEAKRDRYEAELRLETLRREKAARCSGSGGESRAGGRYETRTQAPAGATSSARYEERKSSQAYDDRYHDERSRKYETREAAPKYSSPRSSREKDSPSKTTRSSADRTRSDHKKSRDKEGRQDRDRKYASAESEGSADDGKARYEAEYRRRSEDARKERVAEEIRRDAADARRKAEERRSYDEKLDRQRKMSELESDAVRYIHRSKVEMERPSPSRTNSTRDVRPGEYTESRSRRDRPDAVRRSSARPKDRIAMSSSGRDRERSNIQIVDWEAESVRPAPTFKHSSSPPAEIHLASRAPPQRSFTESSRDHRRAEDAFLPPPYRRSETLPIHKSLRPEMAPSRPSVLRESVTPGASNLEPSSTTTKTYYAYPTSDAYPTSGGGFRLADDVSVANGHRTVLHEPSTREPSARHRQRSSR
jgi:curved DNA-binding protein CbpA